MNEEGKISPGRRRRALRLAIAALLATALVASGVLISGVVLASHNFSDVPTTAFYHNAVEWVFNRAITAGCAVGLYCPDAAVTRGQMAVFLRALGNVLTPAFFYGDELLGATTITSPGVIVCPTMTIPAASYPRSAILHARVSLQANATLSYDMATMFSTDGGATWSFTDAFVFSTAAANATEHAYTGYHVDFPMNIAPTTYRFSIFIIRFAGTGNASEIECNLQTQVINRNPATSPLSPVTPRRFPTLEEKRHK